MLLFESFIYDEEWAKTHYSDFRSPYMYIEDVLRDYDYLNTLPIYARELYMFSVNSIDFPIPTLNKKILGIRQYGTSGVHLAEAQVEYVLEKLKVLGDAVKVLSTDFQNGSIIVISYDITKDEYRWNQAHKVHKEYQDKLNSVQIPEPSIENWIWMLDAYYGNKNPRIIFKKLSDQQDILEKLVIALYLKWSRAIPSIRFKMEHEYGFKDKWGNQTNYIYAAAEKFVKEYQPNEEIQELINSYKMSTKNEQNVPTKLKPITQILDTDSRVIKYNISTNERWNKYATIYLIKVEMSNERYGWINLSRWNDHFYELEAYNTDDIRTICREPKTCILTEGHQIENNVKKLSSLFTKKCLDAIYNQK